MAGLAMALNKSFKHQLEIGHKGELDIEGILQNYGWYTIPTYDYKSEYKKSPRLVCGKDTLFIPDIDASKNGKRIWIECKWKEGASHNNKRMVFNHGIPSYLYKSYLNVERVTGNPVWIFFIEGNQAELTRKEIQKGYKAPNRDNYPPNVLRGHLLSELKNIRLAVMEGISHTFFIQQDLLYFGMILGNYQVPIDTTYGDVFTSLDILEKS